MHKEKDAAREDYIVDVKDDKNEGPVTDITVIKKDFMSLLNNVLVEMFDSKVPFAPTDDASRCEYCDYRKICGK